MRRLSNLQQIPLVFVFSATVFSVASAIWAQPIAGGAVSSSALGSLASRIRANRISFYVYKDADSGFNHGFPSGWFPNDEADLSKLHIDTACLYDSSSPAGCATDPTRFDRTRGTVLRVTFDPLLPGQFVGFHFEEPEHYITSLNPTTGMPTCSTPNCPPKGYNLQGATQVCFDAFSPTPALKVNFGVAGKPAMTSAGQTAFYSFSNQWTHQCLDFSTFGLSASDLQSVHYLFMVQSNDQNAPAGGTILLDNIQMLPVPTAQVSAASFPGANDVFGVVHVSDQLSARVPIPIDQVLANLSTLYESSLAELAILAGGDANDARVIADALVAALSADNQGDPLPTAKDASTGLHSGLFFGDAFLYNDQGPDGGRQGQVKLPGFSLAARPDGSYSTLCGPTHFCLVQDGATGGNNAFAILALAQAHRRFNDTKYLNAARTIGDWIYGVLRDPSSGGFGGYDAGFGGYADKPPRMLQTGKSTENNADIFKAFSALASLTAQQGLAQEAAEWNRRAKIAGDFVMQMYDASTGHFYAGTIPYGIPASPGLQPADPTQKPETKNVFPFVDAQTFVALAMADSPQYRNAIDWRAPMQWMLSNFSVSVNTSVNAPGGAQTFDGLNLVTAPTSGPNGVAWEFTAQAVVALRMVDHLYGEQRFEVQAQHFLDQIRKAQQSAPFGDGMGLVASTMQLGDTLPPYEQCVSSPFQCIAERVGLAATAWAAFADMNSNPFDPITPVGGPTVSLVADAASYQPILSPGSLFSIFGTNLANSEQTATAPLPTSLGTTSVTINGIPGPLLYVGPKQINGQLPYEVAPGMAIVQVVVNGVQAAPVSITVGGTAPRIFTGPANLCIAQNEDGSLNSTGNPVRAGHYVVTYLIGVGVVTPPVPTGAAAPATPLSIPSARPRTVSLASRIITPDYLGLTPLSVGLGQANVLVPADLASGLQSFSVTVGNATSNVCLIAVGDKPVTVPKPMITGVTPSSGPAAGGTAVTISGSDFLPGLVVAFGAAQVATASTALVNSTTIQVKTPPGTGVVSVTVTDPDGQSAKLPQSFTYQLAPPGVTAITPLAGPAAGGTPVQIAGSGFQPRLTVTFGSAPALNVQVINASAISAMTPPGSGTVGITVKNPDGQSATLASAFTYQTAPTITSMTPNPVNDAGGTTVTITGTGFVNGLAVSFGTIKVPASSVLVVSSTSVQLVAPAAPIGNVTVTITNPDGQAVVFNGFSFAKPDASHARVSAQLQACSVGGSVTQAVIPDAFKIVVYAFTNQYYVQPCATQLLNPINPNGSWGLVPSHTGTIYVLLVSANYSPPPTTLSLPPVDGVNVFAVTGPVGTLVDCDVAACPAQ